MDLAGGGDKESSEHPSSLYFFILFKELMFLASGCKVLDPGYATLGSGRSFLRADVVDLVLL